jgi:hypothetical protein
MELLTFLSVPLAEVSSVVKMQWVAHDVDAHQRVDGILQNTLHNRRLTSDFLVTLHPEWSSSHPEWHAHGQVMSFCSSA